MDFGGDCVIWWHGKAVDKMNISLQEVTVRYEKNGKTLAYSQELSMAEEGYTALVAPSGKGKSTLLHLLAGVISPTSGQIVGLDPKETAILFQENRLFPWRRVAQQISDVMPKEGKNPTPFLELVGLAEEGELRPHSLSGGMARRVSLARTLAYGTATGAKLYLLDEPFTGIDQDRVLELLECIVALPVPVLLASHSPLVEERASAVIRL